MLLGIEGTARTARPAGVERTGRPASAPDGLVRGWSGVGVVCEVWARRGAGALGQAVVQAEDRTHFRRHARHHAAAFVATRLATGGSRGAERHAGLAVSLYFYRH